MDKINLPKKKQTDKWDITQSRVLFGGFPTKKYLGYPCCGRCFMLGGGSIGWKMIRRDPEFFLFFFLLYSEFFSTVLIPNL